MVSVRLEWGKLRAEDVHGRMGHVVPADDIDAAHDVKGFGTTGPVGLLSRAAAAKKWANYFEVPLRTGPCRQVDEAWWLP